VGVDVPITQLTEPPPVAVPEGVAQSVDVAAVKGPDELLETSQV
jgi:hypothetical protein